MTRKVSFAILMMIASTSIFAGKAQVACYDAKLRARPTAQIPSEIGDCGSDCIIMSWPWFIDLNVERVVDGIAPGKMVRVLTIQHTYMVSREGTWLLRKNTAGGFNAFAPNDGEALARCSPDAAPVQPYIRASAGRTLDDLREAAIRRYGYHSN